MIPQLQIVPDFERSALYGVKPPELTATLADLTNGRTVSQIVDGNRRFDVVMRLDDDSRSTSGIGAALVATPMGYVPLSRLAKIEEAEGPNQILRENQQRRTGRGKTTRLTSTTKPGMVQNMAANSSRRPTTMACCRARRSCST